MINIEAECKKLFDGYITFDEIKKFFYADIHTPDNVYNRFIEWFKTLPQNNSYQIHPIEILPFPTEYL
jgi:hypothetical protein